MAKKVCIHGRFESISPGKWGVLGLDPGTYNSVTLEGDFAVEVDESAPHHHPKKAWVTVEYLGDHLHREYSYPDGTNSGLRIGDIVEAGMYPGRALVTKQGIGCGPVSDYPITRILLAVS